MKLATRTQLLTDSLPLRIAARAKKMMADGDNVVNLSVGEPDFPTPPMIKLSGIEAIENNFTRYTPAAGIPSLRKTIAQAYFISNDLMFDADQIVVTNGAKQAIASTLLALVEDGDEVIVPVPSYASYNDLVLLAGAKPVLLETTLEEKFRINIPRLAAAITPRTKAIILNSPNNPTGATYTSDEVKELAAFLKKQEIWVISDEIYDKIRFSKARNRSIAEDQDMFDKTVVINGVSKYYAMTGWRIGFAAAPLPVARAIAKIQSQVTGSPCSISQKAAEQAIGNTWDEPPEMVKTFAERAKLISKLMAGIKRVNFLEPEGAFYIFPDVRSYLKGKEADGAITNSYDLCTFLLERHKLAIIPGSAFGMEGFVRFSFAAGEKDIVEGVGRFKQGLEQLL
ncbi:pyridoxal phosphate-dependent aminotransferase [bacterium]|nr:pyridoxal phosphate-dependent aminotransferase [bacterium]